MIKHFLTVVFLFALLTLSAQEKQQYKIDLKIKGLEDSVLYLANYYGDKTYLIDTAFRKGKNNYLFEDKKRLDGGIYIIIGQNKTSLFEFLITDSQDLKFNSEMDNLIEKMVLKGGSNENSMFFRYVSYSNIQYKQLQDYQQRLKNLPAGHDSIALINNQIENINSDIVEYKEGIIEAYPNSFISHFFLAMKSPEIENIQSSSKQDSIKAFLHYKKHFWDYFNFNDDRLLRTPIFHNKLDYYFSAIAHPAPDSLIKEIDAFLNQFPNNSELYRYSLWYFTLKFDQSNRMGYDAILVHFADDYYSKGKASWLDSEVLKNILNEADKRRNLLIGKKAPNMVMQNMDLSPISMYSIDKDYTILYFWDPNCGHCKEETPKLRDFYNKNAKRLNLEIFAVCADTNLKEMKTYILENKLNWINVNGPRTYTQNFHELYNVYSTPYIFVLDKNKTIIAKQINTDQLLDFITDYEIHKHLNNGI